MKFPSQSSIINQSILPKKLLPFIILFLLTNSVFAQDHIKYNNLIATANKFIVAERYEEANIIFDAVDKTYGELYKSIDLYYWAFALASIGEQEQAYATLIRSCKLSNDAQYIYYYVIAEKAFDFLSEEEKKKIDDDQRKVDISSLDQDWITRLQQIDATDQKWLRFAEDSIAIWGNDTINRKKYYQKFLQNSTANLDEFVALILQKGYPDYMKTGYLMTQLLYHMNNEQWNKLESILQDALKNGLLAPFDYAYAYYRTHETDRYQFLKFTEMKTREVPEVRLLMKEMGGLGLGF
ncbi:hypothetical protein [Crocinitomix catalasitica]|uniref:hypothetical protein n=1 Tax=Crocinitomix catalasitica TaxID=184607 RepID=UPI000484B69C|nr:hypothetical protein [Crocinitomix catalasitica]